MWLTIWILMAYGMSQILVYGSIFESLRAGLYKWGADEYAPFQSLGEFLSGLLKCMMCTSTWRRTDELRGIHGEPQQA